MKKALLRTMLLLCALIAGSSSAWADDIVLTLDCATPAATSGSTAMDATTIAAFLNSAAGLSDAENKITCSATSGVVYNGKGSGGGDIPQQCLKVGKASGPGGFTFTIPDNYDNVDIVEITCYGWKTSSSISINGGTAQTFTTAQVETTKKFELASGTKTIDLAVTTSAVCITKIVLKKKNANAVVTPTISGETPFLTSTEVSISCETDGASIQYSTDNGTSWNAYSKPFTLTETTTVKAKATKSGFADSEIATKTFTKATLFANIAALTAETTSGTYYVTLDNAVVTFASGNYAYIQDASGAVAMYKSGHGLKAGDVLNGTANVTYQLKNKNPQITDLSGVTPVAGDAPNPVEVEQANWAYTFEEVLSQYFKVTKATITKSEDNKYYVSLNEENVQLYKQGGSIASLNLSKKYTITGFPTLYNATKELQIFADPEEEVTTAPVINADDVTIEADATSGGIAYTIDNPTGATLTAAVAADCDWISNIQVAADKVTFTTTANTGAKRTTTITLSYTGAENRIIKVTQNAIAYASLPFVFEGGIADIETTPGLTQTGLGTDYGSAPKLKFNDKDDELVLRINEVPGALYFDIKGNSFSGGTFKVQTSMDGTEYEDLATYTELTSTTQTELFNLLPSVRYIKWVYTNKDAGNVGLGNINLIKENGVKIGDAGYTTFWSMKDYNFTGLTAYVVSEINVNSVTLTEITSAPAWTGVILKGEKGIYVLEETDSPAEVGTNLLQTSRGGNRGGESASYDLFALAKKDDVVGFYKVKDDVTIPAYKCFLTVNKTSAPEYLAFILGGETTNIADVRSKMEDVKGEVYDLLGRRVAQPTKGLYIVNGKKVVLH